MHIQSSSISMHYFTIHFIFHHPRLSFRRWKQNNDKRWNAYCDTISHDDDDEIIRNVNQPYTTISMNNNSHTQTHVHTNTTLLIATVCFLILHIVVNLSLLFLKMNGDLHAYTREKNLLVFLIASDLQKCGMSFMLFWTLFYGLVYLFWQKGNGVDLYGHVAHRTYGVVSGNDDIARHYVQLDGCCRFRVLVGGDESTLEYIFTRKSM